jgi:hypothetical protein
MCSDSADLKLLGLSAGTLYLLVLGLPVGRTKVVERSRDSVRGKT